MWPSSEAVACRARATDRNYEAYASVVPVAVIDVRPMVGFSLLGAIAGGLGLWFWLRDFHSVHSTPQWIIKGDLRDAA